MGFDLDLPSPQLPPLRTTANHGDADGCATPTSAGNALPAPLVCPPAPRKPRPARAKRRIHCCYGVPAPAARCYWVVSVPRDLATMFVARSSTGGSLCRPPAAKKIRVHVVG